MVKKTRKRKAIAKRKPVTAGKVIKRQDWQRIGPDGKLIPSRHSGSYDARKIKPKSLKDSNSFMRKLLTVLAAIKATGEQKDYKQITALYNGFYSENKAEGTVGKYLSRLEQWFIIDYVEKPKDARGGFWVLRSDVDITDGDALYERALRGRPA